MSELYSALPRAYVEILRDMAEDEATSGWVRGVLADVGDRALTTEVFPMPTQWRSDDYALFCADPRVRQAEVTRRVSLALDDQIDTQIRMGNYREVSESDRHATIEWVRDCLMAEIAQWRYRNPGCRYRN